MDYIPYPGGYFILNGERYKILKAQMSLIKIKQAKYYLTI